MGAQAGAALTQRRMRPGGVINPRPNGSRLRTGEVNHWTPSLGDERNHPRRAGRGPPATGDPARLLKRLAANVARGDAVDCTVYGTGKASPRDFLSHHTAALSSALVAADANNVLAAAAALDHRLVSGRHGE